MNSLTAALALSVVFAPLAQSSAEDFVVDPSAVKQLADIQAEAKSLRTSLSADESELAAPLNKKISPALYPVHGMDISHYQNTIQWDTVAKQGLSFVYMKATEGDDMADAQFQANWKGAAKAKLSKGAYHFYNFCKTGEKQADQFIKTVPVDEDALPPAIDLEVSDDCKKMPAKQDLQKELTDFITKVKAVYGKSPILYVGQSLYDLYLTPESVGNSLWASDTRPSLTDTHDWTFWQYSCKGKVKGISGPVDLDVFNGTPQQLMTLAAPNNGPLPIPAGPQVASLSPR